MATLLVEYTIVADRQGMSRFDALVDACHKGSRPIVMPPIAMRAGMLLALGMGADPDFRSQIATGLISGLITATFALPARHHCTWQLHRRRTKSRGVPAVDDRVGKTRRHAAGTRLEHPAIAHL